MVSILGSGHGVATVQIALYNGDCYPEPGILPLDCRSMEGWESPLETRFRLVDICRQVALDLLCISNGGGVVGSYQLR
jgi:hypothetical protein